MARILVTGSAQGLGRATAQALLDRGHQVVVHARNRNRAATMSDMVAQGAVMVTADLADLTQTQDLAGQVNAVGQMDAVVHNAGVYGERQPFRSHEGHPRTLAVNVLAPYLLSALLSRADRLVFLTSGMHRSGDSSLDDLDWTRRQWDATQAYCDSKLYVTALAFALARRWPDVRSNAVDPGWVPTRMGGPGAPDDIDAGHETQDLLAAGDPAAADATGQLWFHQQPRPAAAPANDPAFQDQLIDTLARMTGVALP